MTVSTSSDNSASDSQKKRARWLRLPPFWLATTVSLVALATFVFWIRMDAQFPILLGTVQFKLGLIEVEVDPAFVEAGLWDQMWESVSSWDQLGTRITLFASLAGIAIISTVAALLRLYFTGGEKRYSGRRSAVAASTVLLWIALGLLYPRLEWWTIQQRVKGVLPQFQAAAQSLEREWPKKGQHVPELGTIGSVPQEYPNLILLWDKIQGSPYPMHEGFGNLVDKSKNGILRFELAGAFDCRLEKHPPGSSPTSYTNSLGTRLNLTKSTLLIDSWYLCRYE